MMINTVLILPLVVAAGVDGVRLIAGGAWVDWVDWTGPEVGEAAGGWLVACLGVAVWCGVRCLVGVATGGWTI